MEMTRRCFLRSSVGSISVVTLSLWRIPGLQKRGQAAQEAEPEKLTEMPLIWMATGACSGCSITLLNAASPTVRFVLVGNVLPGQRLSLAFHSTLMASGGHLAMETLRQVARQYRRGFVLVVEGSTATKEEGLYCAVGEEEGRPISGYTHVRDLGREAKAALAVGTCAAYGGIPAAEPNPTGCVSLTEIFRREGIMTPVANIPGCPPHPDWIVGTVATILLGGLQALRLDEYGRPVQFFPQVIHDNCPYRADFDRGRFAEHFGEHGCLLKLGCKGPITRADCPIRKWNNGTNWCVQAGHPCIGCTEPEFPFEKSLFQVVLPSELTPAAVFPPALGGAGAGRSGTGPAAVTGAVVGAAVVGAAVGAAKLAQKHGTEPGGSASAEQE